MAFGWIPSWGQWKNYFYVTKMVVLLRPQIAFGDDDNGTSNNCTYIRVRKYVETKSVRSMEQRHFYKIMYLIDSRVNTTYKHETSPTKGKKTLLAIFIQ